ncbi:MAG: CHASE3 domain-containing protein [Pseudomonadota bacterium]
MTEAPADPTAEPTASTPLQRWLDAVPPRVLLTLLVTAAISMVVLAISELAFTEIESSRSAARQVSEARLQLALMRESLLQAESSQRGYLITADTRYLQPFDRAVERSRGALGELQRLAALLPQLREPLQGLQPAVDEKIDEMRLTVHYTAQGNRIDAVQIIVGGKGIGLMEAITQRSQQLLRELDRLNELRTEDINRIFLMQRIGVGLIVFLNLVFLAILGVRTVRHFYEREQHRAELTRQAQQLERTVAERTEELSSLSTYLQTSTEREKSRLARDLHDELGGILTAAKIDASWIEGFASGADPEVQQRMRRLSASLDEAVEVKRRVIENLRPSLLDHLGLAAAVEWYVQETCEKAGLHCEVSVPETMDPVPPEVSIAVYRIVQESLTNALKYAQASTLFVDLKWSPGLLELRVADDGIGIADFEPQHLTHGIAGMRQRARSLGGSFSLRTAPGEGTTVTATFPLKRSQDEAAVPLAAE